MRCHRHVQVKVLITKIVDEGARLSPVYHDNFKDAAFYTLADMTKPAKGTADACITINQHNHLTAHHKQ